MVASLLIIQASMMRTTRQTHINGSKANRDLMNQHIPDETPPELRADWREYEQKQRREKWRSCEWCGGKLMVFSNENHPDCDKHLDFMEAILDGMRDWRAAVTPVGKLMLQVLHEAGFRLTEDEVGCKSILRDEK